jgi:hypothetical protein
LESIDEAGEPFRASAFHSVRPFVVESLAFGWRLVSVAEVSRRMWMIAGDAPEPPDNRIMIPRIQSARIGTAAWSAFGRRLSRIWMTYKGAKRKGTNWPKAVSQLSS